MGTNTSKLDEPKVSHKIIASNSNIDPFISQYASYTSEPSNLLNGLNVLNNALNVIVPPPPSSPLLNNNSPRAQQPKDALMQLKPHQLAMLHKCQQIEKNNKFGVMTSSPGSGKTITLLSLILLDKHSTNVIVVPQNIYYQWINEIKKFCPNYITWKKYINYSEITELYSNNIPKINILITLPIYYSIIADGLATSNHKIDRVIIDEIDSVSSILSKPLSTKMLWLVSASFKKDERLSKLGISMADVDSVKCNCEHSFIKASFPMEEPNYTKIICKNVYIDTILVGMLNSNEYSAINALDYTNIKTNFIKTIATSDAELIEIIVHDIKATIEHETQQIIDLNKSIHEEYEKEIVNSNYDKNKRIMHEALLEKTERDHKKNKEKLACLLERLQDTNTCLICYDEIEGLKCISECCKNAFCETCIALWGKTHKTCPYCRATNLKVFCVNKHVPEPEPIPVPEPVPEPIIIHTSQNKTKLEHIENLFDESKLGSSIIIFSDHSSIFKEISKMLIQKNIRYVELDGGNMDVIEKDLQLFKSGEARVLMTNSSFYGCGMNLENATDVVFLHKTANTMYEQVIGRAQRPVRTCRLNVTELLHENEYIHNNEHI